MDEPKVPKCTCLVGMRSIHRPGCIHALVEQQQDKPEPEPNVLERLEDWKAEYLKLASGSPTDNYISPMAARKIAEELADAIAEIERLQAQDAIKTAKIAVITTSLLESEAGGAALFARLKKYTEAGLE